MPDKKAVWNIDRTQPAYEQQMVRWWNFSTSQLPSQSTTCDTADTVWANHRLLLTYFYILSYYYFYYYYYSRQCNAPTDIPNTTDTMLILFHYCHYLQGKAAWWRRMETSSFRLRCREINSCPERQCLRTLSEVSRSPLASVTKQHNLMEVNGRTTQKPCPGAALVALTSICQRAKELEISDVW